MELTQLRYFRAIARAGNMTGAARSLRVSQPTLSVAVKQLEASLRTTLFLRHSAGVSLTASGEELLRHVDEVMAVLHRAVECAEARASAGDQGPRARRIDSALTAAIRVVAAAGGSSRAGSGFRT